MDVLEEWAEQGHNVAWAHGTDTSRTDLQITCREEPITNHTAPSADFCFCLSYGRLVSNQTRAGFRHTLVVHASDLPHGKGWSPLSWQILEGKHSIPLTLFEAAESVDKRRYPCPALARLPRSRADRRAARRHRRSVAGFVPVVCRPLSLECRARSTTARRREHLPAPPCRGQPARPRTNDRRAVQSVARGRQRALSGVLRSPGGTLPD